MKSKITQEELKKIIHYDPGTGVFAWKVCGGDDYIEYPYERQDNPGYLTICINKRVYPAHRLAFLYMEGYFPENTVDHINRIRDDNRWDNLREATRQCQARNCSIGKNNTSGIKGVWWEQRSRKWCAVIGANGKHHYIGTFADKLEAAYHRYAAEQCLGYTDCDINSSAKQFIDTFKDAQ